MTLQFVKYRRNSEKQQKRLLDALQRSKKVRADRKSKENDLCTNAAQNDTLRFQSSGHECIAVAWRYDATGFHIAAPGGVPNRNWEDLQVASAC